jgi:hypothetical protein
LTVYVCVSGVRSNGGGGGEKLHTKPVTKGCQE